MKILYDYDDEDFNELYKDIPDKPTPEEFAEAMRFFSDRYKDGNDIERTHRAMDDLMCETLASLGYEEGVKIFRDTPKWYA